MSARALVGLLCVTEGAYLIGFAIGSKGRLVGVVGLVLCIVGSFLVQPVMS